MGDRYNLCRLLSSIDDDLSSDESTFFEWARKTSSFSELVSAFRALQLSRRIANVPQLDGPKPALYLIGLWRSFLEQDNVVILMPNLVNLERLPLLMCATYMTRQATRHIVWLVKESDIAATKSKVRKLAESRNWSIGDLDVIVEGQFQRGFGSKPTLDIVTPDTYATMLREGAPLSRVALLLVSCTADLLVDSAPHYKSLTWIFNRYSQESPSVRPKVALLANQIEISSIALSDIQPRLSAYIPNLSVATLSPSDLDNALQPLKQAPQSYFSEIPVPSRYVDPLHTYLSGTLRNWLNIYVTEAESASQHGTFRLEVTNQALDQTEFQRRAKYLQPLLPFHQYLEPIVFENGLVNELFTQQLDLIEQRWTKSGAKLLLLSIRHICTTISILADLGILEATKYLLTETKASLTSIGKRTGKNSILDQLFDGLTHAQSFLTQYQENYLGITGAASSNELTQHQKVAQRYTGRLGFLLRLLHKWRVEALSKYIGAPEPVPDVCVPEILDSNVADKDFDGTNWNPRFIVYLADHTLASPIKTFLNTHAYNSEIFMLGEATDEVLCDDFFTEAKDSRCAFPKVLLSVPSSLRIVHEYLKNHYQAHLQTSFPKYVPGAQYGPHRLHDGSIPASASLSEFSHVSTKDAIVILRLDFDSPAAILREAQKSEYPGEVVLGLKKSTYSLSDALQAYHLQRDDYKSIISSDRDIFAEIKQTLDDIKAKQLKPYVASHSMAPLASPQAPKTEITAPVAIPSAQMPQKPANGTPTQNIVPGGAASPVSVASHNSSKSTSVTPTPQFIEEIVTSTPMNDAGRVKYSDPWMSLSGLSITTADPWLPKPVLEDPLQDEGGSVNYVGSYTGNVRSPTPGDPSLAPTFRNGDLRGFSTSPGLETRSSEDGIALIQKPSLMTPAELKHRSALYQEVLDEHTSTKKQGSYAAAGDKVDERSLDLISALGMPALPQGSTAKMMPGRRPNALLGDLSSPSTLAEYNAAELAAAGVSGAAIVAPVLSTSPRASALGFGASAWSYGTETKLESAASHLFGKSAVMESILGDDALEGISSLKTRPSLSSATTPGSATSPYQTSSVIGSGSDIGSKFQSHSHETSISSPTIGYSNTGSSVYTPTGALKSNSAIAPPKVSSVGSVSGANHASGIANTSKPAPIGAAANGTSYTSQILAALGMPPMRSDTNTDTVSLLHIYCSKAGETDPTYDEVMCGGTDHARKYRSTCTFASGTQFEGWGMRKKDAKKAAAAYALEFVLNVPASVYFDEVALPSAFHGSRTGPQGTSFSAQQDPSADASLTPRSTAYEPNRPNSASFPLSATRTAMNPLSPSYGPSNTTQNGSTGGNKANYPPGLAKTTTSAYGYSSAQSSPVSFNSLSSSNAHQATRRPGTTGTSYGSNGAGSSSTLPDVAGASEYFPTYLAGTLTTNASSNPYGTMSSKGAGEANKMSATKPAASTSAASATGFSSSAPYDWATAITNPIGIVNEYHQKKGLKPPVYTDCGRTSGTDHEPHFLCKVVIYDGRGFDARGNSKKEAKTQAALQVAMALNLVQEPK